MSQSRLLLLGICLALAACHRIEVELDARSAALTKLDASGQLMAATEGPWACVRDARTGLVWENKTDDEGLHHGAWTFAWRDPAWPKQAQGTCNQEVFSSCDTAELVRLANLEGRCGFRDWRLPTPDELATLLDTTLPAPGPKVIACYLPYTQRGSYWTGAPGVASGRQSGQAYETLDFATGEQRALLFNRSAYVRLVRGPVFEGSVEGRNEAIGGDSGTRQSLP